MRKSPGRQQVTFEEAELPEPPELLKSAQGDILREYGSDDILQEHGSDGDAPPASPEPEILPPLPASRYRQRIRIIEAWQYNGRLADAPAWVDRNWAAWGDYDPLRKIDAGPAVKVPTAPNGPAAVARIGDYIVQQEVAVTEDISDVRVEVWAREQFEKFFLSVP